MRLTPHLLPATFLLLTGLMSLLTRADVLEVPHEYLDALEASLGEAESVKPIWQPQNNVPVDEERAQSLMKLVATLEDDDDVQSVYANFEVDDETMAKLSAA